jgi:hypothetical protein
MPLFIPNDFRDGREIMKFASVRELAYAVERVLSNDADWRGFASQSQEWLRRYHTTEHRAQATIDRLKVAFAL